jgi:Pyruvate/2-oxoacid:ferredoxin oxidoreductase delta subunit
LKPYPILVVYCFSGTGNSRNVASWIAEEAGRQNIQCTLINIGNINRLVIDPPLPGALVIFISPVHGFNYPPVMLNFISRFPKGKNNVVLMNTRAGMLIGKWITPGLTGIAFYLASLILFLKGYRILGMVPVDMPSNWISIHPGLNDRTVKYIHAKNKDRVIRHAGIIFSGKKYFRAFREIIQDILVSPVSLLYYFIGRFGFAKTFFASSKCNQCNLCINEYPVKAIIKVNNRPFWTFKCESCMHCMSNCPKKAIQTAHGFIIGIVILNSFLTGLFYTFWDSIFTNIESGIIRFILDQFIFIIVLVFVHRIIHYLMRFRIAERIMVYSSLTKYKFWGNRYKALPSDVIQNMQTISQNKDTL